MSLEIESQLDDDDDEDTGELVIEFASFNLSLSISRITPARIRRFSNSWTTWTPTIIERVIITDDERTNLDLADIKIKQITITTHNKRTITNDFVVVENPNHRWQSNRNKF